MTGYDLINEIGDLLNMLSKAVTAYARRGEEKSKAEYEYRVALAQKILELRAEGYPATLIPDLARGDKEVAKLKLHRDIAESSHDAAKEAIQQYKIQIKTREAQVQREWGDAK